MTLLEGLGLAGLALLAALPGWVNGRALVAVLGLRRLRDVEPDCRVWPRLSIVVAACDEADRIEAALGTLLRLDYPDLQVIVVDDRSTDGTGEIAERVARGDSRLEVVHVRELPPGWLGKVHALHCGTTAATGELLAFLDADVHVSPGALRRAVALFEREQLGHLAVMPRMHGSTLAADATIALFGSLFLTGLETRRIGRPGSDAYAGVGAFGMVRRSDFDRTPGWAWLRMEILDDVGLGRMMVREARARAMLVTGGSELSVLWHPTVPALVRGLEKNGFVGLARARLGRALGAGLVLPAAFLALGLAWAVPWLWWVSLGSLLSALPLAWAYRDRLAHPPAASLLSALGLPVLGFGILRSTVRTLRRGGISWRGTFYSLDELRAGQRVVP